MRKPLLIIDGDLFAHRAYHALPKSIRRRGNKGAGAILGFANFLLRFYETENPRAVLVGWDTLDKPTYRHKALETYQSGRVFDDELVDQLDILPDFVTACGFASAKAAGYEADDFLAAAVAGEERRGGACIVASGDRDTYQLASRRTTIVQPVRAGEIARIGPDEVRTRYGVRSCTGPRFHRAARRFLGPNSGRCRRRAGQRRVAAPTLRIAGEDARSRKVCRAGRETAALQVYRHDGQVSASAAAPQSEADLGQGRQSGARLAAQ